MAVLLFKTKEQSKMATLKRLFVVFAAFSLLVGCSGDSDDADADAKRG